MQKLKMLEFKVVYFTRFGKYHYCEDLREVISLFSIGPDLSGADYRVLILFVMKTNDIINSNM